MGATIQFRPERGTWRVVIHRGGKRRRFECATEQEARARVAAITAQNSALDGWLDDDGVHLTAHALRGWIETYRPTLSQAYEVTAEGLIEHHLIPRLGTLPLRAIDRTRLLAFAESVVESGRSTALALNALSILRRVCQLYVDAGLLDRNPCARVGQLVARVARRHDSEIRRPDAWTRTEADALLELARLHEPYIQGPLLCALHTGMRRGEILGLEWSDVGPAKIAIRRAWVRGRSLGCRRAARLGRFRCRPRWGLF